MGVQILFSKKDPVGATSDTTKNFWIFDRKKNKQFENVVWGSDCDIKKAKLFPRGKAYDRLHAICLSFSLTNY